MAKLSYIETEPKQTLDNSFNIPTDEGIGAILFDLSGYSNPFDGYPLIYHNFKENKVQCVKNMDDASILGILNDGFLNGMLYYHLSQFYDFIGEEQAIYIMLADCSEDWDALQSLQQQVGGRVFQIGIWTSQPIWNRKEDGTIGFTSLITDLQSQADVINGKIGKATHSMVPLSLILSANSNYIDGTPFSYKLLPDAIELECPKVSVLLLQNGIDTVKSMQALNPLQAPVGALGLVMACCVLCGAEESIASLDKGDLNKNEGFNYPEWGIGESGTPINSVNRIWANIISSRGYIIPIDYEGEEASYYLSSDQTLSNGDFSSLANNRVMHKCRRAISTALVPYINSDHIYNLASKTISTSSIAMLTSSITTIIDSVMRNKSGQKQIEERIITFLEDDDLLETNSIAFKLSLKPANYSGFITEEVSHDITL